MPTFNYQQFQCLRQIQLSLRNAAGQEEQFYQYRITPDWQYVITVSYLMVNGKRSLPEMMRFWNWRTGDVERTVELYTPFLCPELMTPDGQYAINKAAQDQVHVWSLQTGETVRQFSGHRGMISRMAISQDGKTIATGGWDKSESYHGIPVDEPGPIIASDRTIMLWDWQNGKLLRTIETKGGLITILHFLDEQLLLSGHDDRHWRIWNWQNGNLVRTLTGVPVGPFGLSHDHAAIVTAFHEEPTEKSKAFRVWDFNTGEPIQTLRADRKLEWLQFSPDDRLVLTRAYHPRPHWERHRVSKPEHDAAMEQWRQEIPGIQVWSIETGQMVGEINQPPGMMQFSFSPDGCNMVAKTEQTIEIWGVPPSR